MEMPHTDFTKVTWMVFVEIGSVVVLATGQTSATGVFSVFADTAVAVGDVASHFSGFAGVGGHFVGCLLVWVLLFLKIF